jgi:hypothetical protein
VQSAIDYYGAYADEIDAALAENQEGFSRLKRLLPRIQEVILTDTDLAAVKLTDPLLGHLSPG